MAQSQLEIDHAFVFCSSELKEVELARQLGFTQDHKSTHKGQGTSCRCVFFEENYLEFIYIDDVQSAMQNPLELQYKADWKNSGHSPFGVGLRGELSDDDRKLFWEYKPVYSPNRKILFLNNRSNFLMLPLIFYLGSTETSFKNNSKTLEPLKQHSNNAKNIRDIQLFGPNYKWPLPFKVQGLDFREAPNHQMTMTIQGLNSTDENRINDLLVLRGS